MLENIKPFKTNQYFLFFSFLNYIVNYIVKYMSKKLPKVLAQQELLQLLNNVYNIKHKAILCTIYGCGLRISECTELRIVDIDSINSRTTEIYTHVCETDLTNIVSPLDSIANGVPLKGK